MAAKRQMIGTPADYLHNLDADKVLDRFGKYGNYQMCVYMMASLNFFIYSYKSTVVSLIADPPQKCASSNDSQYVGITDDPSYTTLATEFGIECEEKHWLEHANGAFMLGNLVYTPIATYLADRYGRRPTFLVSLWLTVLLSIACSFAPTFWSFLVFRFLSGACGAAIAVIGFVLTVESVSASFRSIQALINSLIWVAGILSVGVLHLFIFNWRYLYLCVVGPGLISIAYYWLFPESLHWLIANKKTIEVKRYIKRSSQLNNMSLDLHLCRSDISQNLLQEANKEEGKGSTRTKRNFLDLCRKPALLFHLVQSCYTYIVMNFVYWILTLHSVKLHEEKMVGFFLSAAVEIPAGIVAMLLLFYFGRRTVTIISFLGQTVSLGLTILFPQGSICNLVLALSAKVFNGVIWAAEPLLLSEMAPTTVRNMMYGFVATVGEIGSVFAPYLEDIGDEKTQKIVVASMSLLAILCALTAPETSGRRMPQDLADFDGGPFLRLLGRCHFGRKRRSGGSGQQQRKDALMAEDDSEKALKEEEQEAGDERHDARSQVGDEAAPTAMTNTPKAIEYESTNRIQNTTQSPGKV